MRIHNEKVQNSLWGKEKKDGDFSFQQIWVFKNLDGFIIASIVIFQLKINFLDHLLKGQSSFLSGHLVDQRENLFIEVKIPSNLVFEILLIFCFVWDQAYNQGQVGGIEPC